jgi:hypothetical protein
MEQSGSVLGSRPVSSETGFESFRERNPERAISVRSGFPDSDFGPASRIHLLGKDARPVRPMEFS